MLKPFSHTPAVGYTNMAHVALLIFIGEKCKDIVPFYNSACSMILCGSPKESSHKKAPQINNDKNPFCL